MSKPIPYINEIVSLTIMLLMVVALVAGQADATIHEQIRADADFREAIVVEEADAPFRTTIEAHIGGLPLTISIDAEAEFSHFRFEDE
ncbi:MAG: hypothetical protein GY785_07325 [Gammaproteobacteria bacterium]|nr:hypothetical protein [Gammaproteobacteria bacterium]